MFKFAWMVNVGSICGLIIVCGILVPKDTVTGAPVVPVVPVVLADGMWGQVNAGKAQFCRTQVLEMARNTPHLSDAEHLAVAKDIYWDCMVDIGGVL